MLSTAQPATSISLHLGTLEARPPARWEAASSAQHPSCSLPGRGIWHRLDPGLAVLPPQMRCFSRLGWEAGEAVLMEEGQGLFFPVHPQAGLSATLPPRLTFGLCLGLTNLLSSQVRFRWLPGGSLWHHAAFFVEVAENSKERTRGLVLHITVSLYTFATWTESYTQGHFTNCAKNLHEYCTYLNFFVVWKLFFQMLNFTYNYKTIR